MLATIIITVILLGLIVLALNSLKHQKSCFGCSGDCSSCAKVNAMKESLAKAKECN